MAGDARDPLGRALARAADGEAPSVDAAAVAEAGRARGRRRRTRRRAALGGGMLGALVVGLLGLGALRAEDGDDASVYVGEPEPVEGELGPLDDPFSVARLAAVEELVHRPGSCADPVDRVLVVYPPTAAPEATSALDLPYRVDAIDRVAPLESIRRGDEMPPGVAGVAVGAPRPVPGAGGRSLELVLEVRCPDGSTTAVRHFLGSAGQHGGGWTDDVLVASVPPTAPGEVPLDVAGAALELPAFDLIGEVARAADAACPGSEAVPVDLLDPGVAGAADAACPGSEAVPVDLLDPGGPRDAWDAAAETYDSRALVDVVDRAVADPSHRVAQVVAPTFFDDDEVDGSVQLLGVEVTCDGTTERVWVASQRFGVATGELPWWEDVGPPVVAAAPPDPVALLAGDPTGGLGADPVRLSDLLAAIGPEATPESAQDSTTVPADPTTTTTPSPASTTTSTGGEELPEYAIPEVAREVIGTGVCGVPTSGEVVVEGLPEVPATSQQIRLPGTGSADAVVAYVHAVPQEPPVLRPIVRVLMVGGRAVATARTIRYTLAVECEDGEISDATVDLAEGVEGGTGWQVVGVQTATGGWVS